MTEYFDNDNGVISDNLQTHGIVSQEYLEPHHTGVEWQTAMSPRGLRDLADLMEFCYPDASSLDVGLLEPYDQTADDPPALVIGKAEDNQQLMLCPRTDGYVSQEDTQENTLEQYE